MGEIDKIDYSLALILFIVSMANGENRLFGVILVLCIALFVVQYAARHAFGEHWRALGVPESTPRWLLPCLGALREESATPRRALAQESGERAEHISVPLPDLPPLGPYTDDNPFAPATNAPRVPGVSRLYDIANDDNILIVGPKGSGKTTLLRALIRIRRGQHLALDPHNAPGKWPCNVVGGGRDFGAIDQILQGTFQGLNRRYQQLNSGAVQEGQFKRHTLVGDEWRAISQELPGDKPRDGSLSKLSAGAVLGKVLAEGRKVGLCVLAGSQNDTAASTGMAGDMALLACFDWIVYLGALAVRKLPEAARQTQPAVAYNPERDISILLDVSDALVLAGPIVSNVSPPQQPEPGSVQSEPGSVGFGLSEAGSIIGSVRFGSVEPVESVLPANRTELTQLMQALTLFAQTGKETEAIERAFNVRKGSSKEYQRARALFKTAQEVKTP